MARRYVRVLDDKIKRLKGRVEMGTATAEDIAWLQRVDDMKQSRQERRKINLNPKPPEPVIKQKRLRLGQNPDTLHIQRYHHPHSRRGI